MAFSDVIVAEAWERCGEHCECTNSHHSHKGRCRSLLKYFRRGINIVGGWEAQHITPIAEGGNDEIINCKIVCIKCYQAQLQPASGYENIIKRDI